MPLERLVFWIVGCMQHKLLAAEIFSQVMQCQAKQALVYFAADALLLTYHLHVVHTVWVPGKFAPAVLLLHLCMCRYNNFVVELAPAGLNRSFDTSD